MKIDNYELYLGISIIWCINIAHSKGSINKQQYIINNIRLAKNIAHG